MIPNVLSILGTLASLIGLSVQEIDASSSATQNVSITSGGVARYYLLTLPPNFNSATATPVIFSFHGGTKDATNQQAISQLSNPAFNNFSIAVYPQGINDSWENEPNYGTVNDIQFTSDIIDQLESTYKIDTSRIWASGKSDGGGFTNQLACDPTLSKRIAAFAPVSGAYYINATTCDPNTITIPCNPGRKNVPIIEFHGQKDTTIAYGGGSRKGDCLPSVTHWTQAWAARDGLSTTNSSQPLTSDTVVYTFGTGSSKGLVTQVTDSVLGHDWPSTVNYGEAQTASFNATPIIINFFLAHSLQASS